MEDKKKDYYDLPTMVDGDQSIKSSDPNKNNSFNVKVVLIVIILICVLLGSLFVLQKVTNMKNSPTTSLNVEAKQNLVYEVGAPIDLSAKNFVVSKKDAKKVEISSDLMSDSDRYTYDETTHQVVSKGKSYLATGNYTVTLTYEGNSEDINFRVKDTKAPAFVGFKQDLYIDQEAQDVDLSKYFFATDLDEAANVSVDGDVDYSKVGDYTIKVTASDASGNKTEQDCTVHIIDPDSLETYSCLIDGSIPLSSDTLQKVEANVITFNYEEVSDEIHNAIESTHYDTSSIAKDSYYKPGEQTVTQEEVEEQPVTEQTPVENTTEYNTYG